MHRHVTYRLKFLLERLVLRGAHYRLLIIAALIGALSAVAGAIIHVLGTGVEGGLPGAIWWAFLRLSDPGYLGDDVGTLNRLVSTVLTVLGYVVFLGALVAIMTQWLQDRMRSLEAGLTPIAQRDHVLIIGWTNRTPAIVGELLMSNARVRRFLRAHGTRTLRIAILAEQVTTRLGVELRERLGPRWNERQVILRTGSPLRVEHLQRVDFIHASAVIMPASDIGGGGPDHADTRTIKTLLSMANHPHAPDAADLPLAVAEIFDSRRIDLARRAYRGPVEILASDAIIGRLLAQNVRHAGLSHVYGELLTHGRGNEIHVRDCGQFAGMQFHELAARFEQAVLLGIVRIEDGSFVPLLNPPPRTQVRDSDRLVMIARSYAATEPAGAAGPGRGAGAAAPGRDAVADGAGHGVDAAGEAGVAGVESAAAPAQARERLPLVRLERPRRVLLLGWNHKVPAMLGEFDSYVDERFEIDVVSTTPAARRQMLLQRHGVKLVRTVLRHTEADFATPAMLEQTSVAEYDNIVLLGSDRFDSGEESDARSILGYLLLRDQLPAHGPAVLVELLDPGNLPLFRDMAGEFLISPVILSHMLAQVALRRELRSVFDELFGPGGAEIVFRSPADYGIEGERASFREIEVAAAARAEIALGVRAGGGPGDRPRGLSLNPPREQRWLLDGADEIVALTTGAAGVAGV
jgi:ion channel POLLUX/CASTOR